MKETSSSQQQTPKTLTLSDLLRLSRPFTATSALNHSRQIKPQSPHNIPTTHPFSPTQKNLNPKTLKPLNHPTIISGILTLPTTATSSSPNSFIFSDGSSSVPCDILGFDSRAIGTEIHIIAWNFIPFGSKKDGFLEIISWVFPNSYISSIPDRFSLCIGNSNSNLVDKKARYCVRGALRSVSPVSVVPCSSGPNCNSTNICGFLVNILVCGCKLCNTKVPVMGSANNHSFLSPIIVYFCGYNASSWHPVIVKLVGSVISLEGLKKKLVFIGEEQSQLMYVTTENSFLILPKLLEKWVPGNRSVVKGKDECGSYMGTITGIYMKGMVIELDRKVVLVVTDQQIIMPYSVRVGAIVSVRNVHFVNPSFSWTKILILGACFNTSVCLELFSPLETGCCMSSQSQSLLGTFIDSLVFSARLWVLLLVSSFRKKFNGIYSEQEILGTKHFQGVTRKKDSCSHLQHQACLHQLSILGLFREYCKHDSLCCFKEPHSVNLKLVVPISYFITHCNTTWIKMLLEMDAYSEINSFCDQRSSFFCEGVCYSHSLRIILPSKEIGVALLGSVKISPSSGRLQLVDSTGSIDVLIPDLHSILDANDIYEVNDFTLVMEGVPEHDTRLEIFPDESFSCRSIFTGIPCKKAVKLQIYILYHLRDTKLLVHPFSPTLKDKGNFAEFQIGIFHILLVTHKYPFKQKFQVEPVITNNSSVFAEAFLLPWDLYILGKDNTENQIKLYQDCVPSKRLKTEKRSSDDHLSSLLEYCTTPEISCSVTYRSIKNQLSMSSATLRDSNSIRKIQKARKLLLEFKSQSFCKYQLLKVGDYYIIKQHNEDVTRASNAISNVKCSKIIINSKTHLWSSSFSSNQVNPNGDICDIPITVETFGKCDIQNELNYEFSQIKPALTIHLSSRDLDFLMDNLKRLDISLKKPLVSLKEDTNFSASVASYHQLPEGNLISFHGKVMSVHNCGSSANSSLRSDFCNGQISKAAKSVCIHVLVDDHHVRILVSSSNNAAYPVGFGSGCTADFHRILVSSGRNELIMTPSSYIEIKSISLTAEKKCDKGNSQIVRSELCSAESLSFIPSVLVSEVMQYIDLKPLQFHCRIVAICILLMERKKRVDYPEISIHTGSALFQIPLAGFVMEDGSSASCFWTSNETAATLMRLNENFSKNKVGRNTRGTTKIKEEYNCNTVIHHIGKIVTKHGVVSVRNYGSIYDSTSQDLILSASDSIFNSSDEKFLKSIIFNACFGSPWTIVGTLMDSHAVSKLEKQLAEMDMTLHPMKNIWVQEVHYVNPLAEARRVMQELMN